MFTAVGTVRASAAHYILAKRFNVWPVLSVGFYSFNVKLAYGHYIVARTGLLPFLQGLKVIFVLHNPVFCIVLIRQASPMPSSS